MPEAGVWRFWTRRARLEAPMVFVVTDGTASRASPESPAGSDMILFFFILYGLPPLFYFVFLPVV